MDQQLQQTIIENYVEAYNRFDVEGMLKDMAEDIRFENVSGGQVNLITRGIGKLKEQALQAAEMFREREQKITAILHRENEAEVEIDYTGVLAIDIPGGPKAGERLEMKGKSIFRFENNRIVELRDLS
jgi:ketosteroid isomerase-like protein